MAWTDTCKVAFRHNAEHLLHKAAGKGITRILKQLSTESGIPFNTLKRWFYANHEEKSIKNDTTAQTTDNKPENNEEMDHDGSEHPLCEICGNAKVQRKRSRNGDWYYYTKCHTCRTMGTPKYEESAIYKILCPHCGKHFKLKECHLIKELTDESSNKT